MNIARLLCLVVALATLTGCASLYTDAALDTAREGIDSANALALWQLCEGTTHAGYVRMCDGREPMCDALDQACAARAVEWRPVPRESEVKQ